MYFRNPVDAIGHTPMIELSQLNPNKKVKILAKLEGQNVGGSASVKDRIAKYMVEKAEQSGQLTKDKIILEATSGNTGIALAWLGCQKGYKVTIIMPDSMSLERRQLLKICGAELILTPGALKMNGAIDTAREMAAKDSRYFMPDQFTNPANPLAHYETTGVEILEAFPYDKIDVLVVGIGTGGTITGVSRRLKERFPKIKVVGVEPLLTDPIQGLRNLEEYMPPIIDLSLITKRKIVTSQQAKETTKLLMEREGIFAGLSSGAIAYQAFKTAQEMDKGCLVTVLPDGGWKYLSMDFWMKNDQGQL
jgi:[CysO sulfur-carrier protein]-thiocarboxylate-dependent cysteine synthase